MSDRLVTDEELDKALDYLARNAAAIGEARKRMIMTNHMVKHTKALEMQKHNDMPVSAQEREAIASDAYKKACYEEAVAAGEFEKMRALREAAAMKIGAWQTESANLRGIKI